jgi:hypothetical protein
MTLDNPPQDETLDKDLLEEVRHQAVNNLQHYQSETVK